jgi:hyperosmotically inducible protein
MRISTPLRLLVVLLLIAFLAPACQSMTGRSAGRYVDDQTITAKVKSKLVGDKASNLTRVGVTTVNGVVHLDGVVDSVQDKVAVEETARTVDGVVNVVNQLQVSGTGAASPR